MLHQVSPDNSLIPSYHTDGLYFIDRKLTALPYIEVAFSYLFLNLIAQNDGYTSSDMQNENTNTDRQGGKCNLILLYYASFFKNMNLSYMGLKLY